MGRVGRVFKERETSLPIPVQKKSTCQLIIARIDAEELQLVSIQGKPAGRIKNRSRAADKIRIGRVVNTFYHFNDHLKAPHKRVIPLRIRSTSKRVLPLSIRLYTKQGNGRNFLKTLLKLTMKNDTHMAL